METTTIDNLTDECLERIFSFLPMSGRMNAEEVCKRWKNISSTSWESCEHIDIDLYRYRSVRKFGHVVILYGPFLTSLTVRMLHTKNQVFMLKWIIKCCPQLKKIFIDVPFDACLMASLEDYIDNKKMKEEFLEIFSNLKELVTVCVDGFPTVAFTTCSKIQHLHVESALFEEPFLRGMRYLPYLTTLRLNECLDYASAFEDIIYAENLRVLEISNCVRYLQDHHVTAILKNCTKLVELKLSRHCELKGKFFEAIIKHENLRILKLDNIDWIQAGRFFFGGIEHLEIVNCPPFLFPCIKRMILNSRNFSCFSMTHSYNDALTREIIRDIDEIIPYRMFSQKFTLIINGNWLPEDIESSLIVKRGELKKFHWTPHEDTVHVKSGRYR